AEFRDAGSLGRPFEHLDLPRRQRGGGPRAMVRDHAQLVLRPLGGRKYDDVAPGKHVGERAIENVYWAAVRLGPPIAVGDGSSLDQLRPQPLPDAELVARREV